MKSRDSQNIGSRGKAKIRLALTVFGVRLTKSDLASLAKQAESPRNPLSFPLLLATLVIVLL